MSAFVDTLRSGPVLLMDGGMGTELQRAGAHRGACFEAWNLFQAEKVRAIHRAYVGAGATILLTNTFQANPQALARHGLERSLEPIFQAGIRLARDALPESGFILVDIGPTNERSWPHLNSFVGADAILLETFSDPDEVSAFVTAHRSGGLDDLPVLASFTFQRLNAKNTLSTFKGYSPERCASQAQASGVVALGANCGRDLNLNDFLEILGIYRNETDLPLFVRPNAGTPHRGEKDLVYPRPPLEMASWLPDLIKAGTRMIGGCCGTTPEHIAAFRHALDALS